MLENVGNILRGVPVTALYGALCAIFYVAISINVSRIRGKVQVFLVPPPKDVPEPLHRAIRAHGNAAEYLPLGILLLLILELSGGNSMTLHILGGLLLVVRICHAVGAMGNITPIQIVGALGTWLVVLAEAIYLLVLRFR